jgi:serine/threonine protein kinase
LAPANALEALVGRTLGGCRIETLLGRGGMGAVYRAQQESLGRAVALKVMLPGRDADPQFASRFQREARVVAALNHPHVVQVYDTGRADDGMLYLIMEFVDGRSLAQVIRDQGPLPIPVVLAVIRESAEGLAAAHAKALVHRDIKPDNLMISADARVKVMDFGLARPTEGGSGDSALTMSGMILGTPNYISPEAARGEPADIRADLYSLGVTLWQCIAGKLPFTGPTPVQVLVQHIEAAPPDLAAAVPGCPRAVAELCRRLLAKRPEERFASPAELVAEIQRRPGRRAGRRRLGDLGPRAGSGSVADHGRECARTARQRIGTTGSW